MSYYSSTAEVRAFTHHLLDGAQDYSASTRPSAGELGKFLDRACGVLNVALAGEGFSTPVTVATAKLACDDWVTARATEYVELTQRGVGYSGEEDSRVVSFRNMAKAANQFAKENAIGFKRLGVPVAYGLASGLSYTGLAAPSERSDPDDSTLEQPFFSREMFDNPAGRSTVEEDD